MPHVSPAGTFERRVRVVVRRMLKLHPTMTRDIAMAKVRQIPPAQLVSAMHRIQSRIAINAIHNRRSVPCSD